jgi:hypothetical protein
MNTYFLGDDLRRLLQTQDWLLQEAADPQFGKDVIEQVRGQIEIVAAVTPVFVSEFMLDDLVATDPNTLELRTAANHDAAMYGDDYTCDMDADYDEWRDRLDALRVEIVSELPPNAVELTLQSLSDIASTIAQPAVVDRRRKWDIGGIPPWVWYLLVFPTGKGLLSSQVAMLVNIAIADALNLINRSALLGLVQQLESAGGHAAQPDSSDNTVNPRKLSSNQLALTQPLFEPKDPLILNDEPEDGDDTLGNGDGKGGTPVPSSPNGRNPGSGNGATAEPAITQDQANSSQTVKHSEPENLAQASGNFDRTNILSYSSNQPPQPLPQRWYIAAVPQQEGTAPTMAPTMVPTTAAPELSSSQSITMFDRLINDFTAQPSQSIAPNLGQSAWASGRDVMLVSVLAGNGSNTLVSQDTGSNPVFYISLTPGGQSSNPIVPTSQQPASPNGNFGFVDQPLSPGNVVVSSQPVDPVASPVNGTSKPDIGLTAVPIDSGNPGSAQPQPTLPDRTLPLPTPGQNPQIPDSQTIPGNPGTVQPPTQPPIEQSTTIEPGQNRPLATQSFFQEGTFTVGSTGEITIDFLFDGGFYVGELAIFSTSGMEKLVNDPTAFITEALRRSNSHTTLGDIVISDFTEGAKSSGCLGESDFNRGEYRGPKTFSLTAGQQYGLMLIPNASLQDSERKINLASDRAPIFSMFQTENGNLFGQRLLAQIDRNTIGIEDIHSELSDLDYNDLVIRLDGASINATPIRYVIAPENDWTQSGGTGSNGKTYPWNTTNVGDVPSGYQPSNPIGDSRSTDDWHRC